MERQTSIHRPFTAACVQFNPILGESDRNIDALLEAVQEAAESGARLIVTPEMATTGYHYESREAIAPFVDTIPGYTTSRFEELCRRYAVYVVIGMPEVDPATGLYYNAAALIGPDGYIGKYRKVHLWETEAHWAAWGDLGVPVFDTEIGNIAINICMDSIFFESARLAAVQGADILVFPTNSTAQSVSMLQARAETNGLYIVSANRTNTELGYHMIGASAVWSPHGEKLAESAFLPTSEEDMHETTILYARIDPDLYRNDAKARLSERRPELYKELMLYKAPWDFSKSRESKNLTVAVLQYEPVIGDKQANLAKIQHLIRLASQQAKAQSAKLDLLVLPELSTTGPLDGLSVEKCFELSETSSGTSVSFMGQLAVTYQVSIVFGFVEREEARLYNTAVLINPDGEVEGTYRQTHLRPDDKRWAAAGDRISVFPSKTLGRIGLMIGYDALFPEVAGVLAVGRADVIAIPSSWSGPCFNEMAINPHIAANSFPEGAIAHWATTAIGAQAYTIVANFTGTNRHFGGRSGVYTLDPLYGLDQPVVAAAEREEILLAQITTLQHDWWFNQEKLIASRRTEAYKRLVTRPVNEMDCPYRK
ncbi:nitrilase [Brevibacillus sp. SYP-B805]|uniref:nitrilase-related carbon-nitrogen hydrolase n=1 Tax=Brevibacillus sp. SYP-B805 TaxID=1578199 RepID=UPI0013ED6BDF|nr:nitrilase-related carbon-nitrogen hydrolase [Brevibacillus sp. SYP-B805]NGQ94976.1 nitrilase [Brevibacillus sp. SYP-B805]